jgi:uncharacterized membrane-anchored protein YhcB (DUF1043 family)
MLGLSDLNAAKQAVLNSPWARYVAVLVLGMAIGAVFYPTKRIEEKLRIQYEQQISQLKETNQKTVESLTQSLNKSESEKKDLEVTTTKKISRLTVENASLKSKKTEKYYKIVHPDGTIEVRDFKEADVDQNSSTITSVKQEFDQKVKDIEMRYAKIHEERVKQLQQDFSQKEEKYQETIASLQKDKTVSVNQKMYGLEVGKLSNGDYYGHVDMTVFGPMFIGVQTQSNFINNNAVGAGIGIRF